MPIIYNKKSQIFNLKTSNSSYILQILKSGHIAHLYYGKKIESDDLSYIIQDINRVSYICDTDNIKDFKLETIPQEYPSFGNTDLRTPAFELKFEDGSTVSDFRYSSHNIYKGKKKLQGLPATYAEDDDEATTLEITLVDELKNVSLVLAYTVFEELNAITRSVKFINNGSENVRILRALSADIDFDDDEFDFIHLSGAWARERQIIRSPLREGSQSVESRRGASSHAHNPFFALVRKETTENMGDAYGFSLVYSGNFLAHVEVDMYKNARAQIGINPFEFEWLLESNEEFQAPEAVLVYSDKGINGMSQIYHDLYRKRLCRGKYRDRVRPVLINNWEATYFDFDEEKLKSIAKEASNLGVELFVLDDGWFGKRNDDTTSLGDWVVNEEKIRGGLNKLSKDINNMNLKFGLWIEPEMVSPKSNLYESHPDWCIHVNGRRRSEARHQLVLDLSRQDVCDYLIDSISSILSSGSISYIKWDMNRNMTEVCSELLPSERQGETAHRYMLGLYRILDELTFEFPDILFEGCAGGGGRFDPGMLYYFPQIWTSDDTDSIERLGIQFGTSLVYPNISMGCHVSAVPNHQVGRITSLNTRGNVAMFGNFGYELDVTKISHVEKEKIKRQIKLYKEIRDIIQFGKLYRLMDNSNEYAWMNISDDGKRIVVTYVRKLVKPNVITRHLKLAGLDENCSYKIIDQDELMHCDEGTMKDINEAVVKSGNKDDIRHDNEEIIRHGDELMCIGLKIPVFKEDFSSKQWILEKLD